MSTKNGQPPHSPNPKRFQIHRDLSDPKHAPQPKASIDSALIPESLRKAFANLTAVQPQKATVDNDHAAPPRPKSQASNAARQSEPAPLRAQDPNQGLVSSNTYAAKPVVSSTQNHRPLRSPRGKAEAYILKPRSPNKVWKSADQVSPQQPNKHRPQQNATYYLPQPHSSSPAKQNHLSRKSSAERPPKAPYVLKSPPPRPESAPANHPAYKPIPVQQAPSPPPRLLASDVEFKEHPLSLIFNQQVEFYKQSFFATEVKSVDEARSRLQEQQAKQQEKEKATVEKYNADVKKTFTPLNAEQSINGNGTIDEELEKWRHEAKEAWREYKTLATTYGETIKAISAFKEDMSSGEPAHSNYAKDVAEINEEFETKRRHIIEKAIEDMQALHKEVEEGEIACKKRLGEIRATVNEYLTTMAEEA